MKPSFFSPAEERSIQQCYEKLIRQAKSVLKNGSAAKIEQAFLYAREAHGKTKRSSGDPYILHPLEVAHICVTEIGLGETSIVSALLHDVVEDTPRTIEDIQNHFGEEVARTVEGLTKITGAFRKGSSAQAENFRKILLTLVKDARVIIVKIADRLHNMRTLESLPRNKQLRIASETIYLYAPLAHRLGLYNIKSMLEDLYLKYSEPETFRYLTQKVSENRASRDRFIKNFIAPIEKQLNASNILATLKGRPKSIHSIWNKMKRQNIPFEEVYDLFAIRIIIDASIVEERSLCWRVYAIITDTYAPNADRLRDWISMPKSNGYESLHITVMSREGKWIEVQIRSKRMDALAERGYAAHWKYKQGSTRPLEQKRDQWIDRIREVLEHRTDEDALEFMQDFYPDLSHDEICVFTPKGEPRLLPNGSSVLDFAFSIHTEVGAGCIGAKINHKLLPIDHKISNGDQIEVLHTTKQYPRREWLKLVTTSRARTSIRQVIEKQERAHRIEGKELLARYARKRNIRLKKTTIAHICKTFHVQTPAELYHHIGTKKINKQALLNLPHTLDSLPTARLSHSKSLATQAILAEKNVLTIGNGLDNIEYKLSACCYPVPGDEVFGFVSGKGGIMIHRANCKNAPQILSQHGDRMIRVQWTRHHMQQKLLVSLLIEGIDRKGIVKDILHIVVDQLDTELQAIQIESRDKTFTGHLKVYIQNKKSLDTLTSELEKMKEVSKVLRTDI